MRFPLLEKLPSGCQILRCLVGMALIIFSVFVFSSAMAQSKQHYRIIDEGSVTDLQPYLRALDNTNLEPYRMENQEQILEFDSGLRVALISSRELEVIYGRKVPPGILATKTIQHNQRFTIRDGKVAEVPFRKLTFEMIPTDETMDLEPYIKALLNASLDQYRLMNERRTLIFENGLEVMLFSAVETHGKAKAESRPDLFGLKGDSEIYPNRFRLLSGDYIMEIIPKQELKTLIKVK